MLRIGGAHNLRKALFIRGIRQGFLEVEEVEESVPPGLLTAAEKWLLYFSLASSDVELRDRKGNLVSLEDLVPEYRGIRLHAGRYAGRAASPPRPLASYSESELIEMLDADHFG